MLSDDDHPGVFVFMVGIIVVVMTAVGLSLLMDRKFSFSRKAKSLESAILASKEEIELLKAHAREGASKLPGSDAKLTPGGTNLESIQQRFATDGQRLATLKRTRETLRREIPSTTEEFAKYRNKYRAYARGRAVGESLGDLTVRGGREYHQVVISQVTDVGLEIRHADGIARIQAPDLDQAFHDRFQWNEEERRARLNEERAVSESLARLPEESKDVEPASPSRPKGREAARQPETPNPDTAKIESFRAKVMVWKSKVSQVSTELSQARSATYGSQSSVPGSLETWQAKADRLTSELARAKAGLAAARASLAAVSPYDPLLRLDPAGN